MAKTAPEWEHNGYRMRLGQACDAENYYRDGFLHPDPEVARLTGCRTDFAREEVVSFFLRCLDDPDRFDFLIFSPEGRIVGESVVNEIDWDVRSANFRIGLFHTQDCCRGLGSWAVRTVRDYAFEALRLHRLSLDVFAFNPRAEHVYAAAGFRREGVLRDALRDGERYADDILMSLLEDEWRALKVTAG